MAPVVVPPCRRLPPCETTTRWGSGRRTCATRPNSPTRSPQGARPENRSARWRGRSPRSGAGSSVMLILATRPSFTSPAATPAGPGLHDTAGPARHHLSPGLLAGPRARWIWATRHRSAPAARSEPRARAPSRACNPPPERSPRRCHSLRETGLLPRHRHPRSTHHLAPHMIRETVPSRVADGGVRPSRHSMPFLPGVQKGLVRTSRRSQPASRSTCRTACTSRASPAT